MYKQILRQLLVLRNRGNLDMISMTFFFVTCDAGDPCSVNTTYDRESSFTMSPRSTTRPLYFLVLCGFLEFLVLRVNEINYSYSSGIVECRFFIGSFLPVLQLCMSSKFYPELWP